MKKSILFLLLACFASISVCMAQDDQRQRPEGMPPRMDPKMRTEQMIKILELNEQQAAQFRVVMEEQQKQMEAQMQSGERPTPEKMEEQRQAIQTVLQLILTEDQMKKYKEITSHGPGGRDGQRGEGRGPRPMNHDQN